MKFIQTHCVLGEGDYFGQPFKLRQWQKAFIYRLYELDEDGHRRYRRALLGLPKGNGKTPLAAAIALYELCGGRTSPVIPVGAASFEQADLVFGDMKTMCRESPTLSHVTEVFDTEILLREMPGRAYRVAAAAGTNDGQRPTCFISDELHEWTGNKERVHLVLANGTAKRSDSLQLNITTAGYDKDTLLGRLYDYGKQVQNGEIDDPGFLFEWWEAPESLDISTEEGRKKAVKASNPAVGDFVSEEPILSRYHEIPEFEWRRYHLNQWTESNESWLPAGSWQSLESKFELVPDIPTFAGVDASTKHDSTAIVLTQWHEDKLRVKARIWERPLGQDGRPQEWKLPIAEVENYLRQKHKDLNLQGVAYDPALFERSAQQLETEGLPMIEFPQSDSRVVPACQATYELVLQERLTHDGDQVLARHIASAAAVEARNGGWRLKKSKSKAKMDGAIALVLAVDLAVHDEGGSVYEDRGMVTV